MKHSHYKKNVAGLSMIDVYRVLDLFGVTDPCIQHAAKKLLATGLRGHKDAARDIQDAIDTLERWKEMRVEDRQRQSDRHPMTPNVIEPAFSYGCLVCGKHGGHGGLQCPKMGTVTAVSAIEPASQIDDKPA